MAKAILAIALFLSFAAPVPAAESAQAKSVAAQPITVKPEWAELTPAQRSVLEPLKQDWGSLDTVRRKKWVGIADRYPKMNPNEQKLLRTRMQDWAKLSSEQRRVAREKYLSIKKMPAAKREEVKAQWHQYQQSLAAKSEPSVPEPAGITPAQ
jgi:Protein of unknown function (DUF3106)